MSKKPTIKLTGKASDFNSVQQNDKIKSSNFYLTINSNQSYKLKPDGLENDTEVFEDVIKDVLANLNDYVTLPNGVEWDDNTIRDVNIDYVIEKGSNKGFLHSHILIKIKHTTNVKLDFKKIKTKIFTDLGLKNIYMKNYVSKNNDQNILQYINKYVKKDD